MFGRGGVGLAGLDSLVVAEEELYKRQTQTVYFSINEQQMVGCSRKEIYRRLSQSICNAFRKISFILHFKLKEKYPVKENVRTSRS